MSLSIFNTLEALKNTQRRCWMLRGVPEPESVADHMYQMAMICLMYPWDNETDRQRAIEMAIVNGAPEAVVGDITPADHISQEEKHKRETLGLEFLACLTRESNPTFATRIQGLWDEYQGRSSRVAQVVRQISKLEALQQASVYASRYRHVDLTDYKGHRAEINDHWLAHQADMVLDAWQDTDQRRHTQDVAVVFVIGGPGVGKSTQCAAFAADNSDVAHVSVGDLLRTEQETPGSQFGEFIRKSIRESVIIPAMLAMVLLQKALDTIREKGKTVVLIDGFPRSLHQLQAFEEQVRNSYATIFLDCPEEVLLERLASRAQMSRRDDDNPDSIRKRMQTYRGSSTELLQRLSKNPLKTISNAGSISEVKVAFQDVVGGIIQQ